MNSVNGVLLGGAVAAARDVSARKNPGAFKNALDDAAAPSDETKKVAKAARGFEALMIGQVMKEAHGSDSEGWFGAGDDDESSSTAIQMAEEYLGQAMAQSGGLGIAKMVVKNLSKPPGGSMLYRSLRSRLGYCRSRLGTEPYAAQLRPDDGQSNADAYGLITAIGISQDSMTARWCVTDSADARFMTSSHPW